MKIFYLLLSFSFVFAEDSSAVEKFIQGNRLFAQDIYNELLLDNEENILVSPFSAEIVLGLAQSGAKGDTGDEIRTAVHFANSKEETEEQFKAVLPLIQSDWVTVYSANEIYIANDYNINQEFQDLATDVYSSGFEDVSFSQSIDAVEKINDFVKEKTNGFIDKFADPGDFSPSTRIALLNALYFQGNWSTRFDSRLSKKANFYKSDQEAVESEMMTVHADIYNYYESPELDAQILEIPFQGREASLTVVLPNKKEGIALLEKQIGNVFTKPKYTSEVVQVVLPKFKIETTLNVEDKLRKLGVQRAFSLTADFSGIAGPRGELYITGAKQKAAINVNELGLTAAAVTEISIGPGAVLVPQKFFVADHPFVFYVTFKDIVLFEGRVLSPN